MVKFAIALTALLATQPAMCFQGTRPKALRQKRQPMSLASDPDDGNVILMQRRVSVSSSNPEFSNPPDVGDAINNSISAVGDSIANAVRDEPDLDEAQILKKRERVKQRTNTYKVTLPLESTSTLSSPLLKMGMTLAQINKGRVLSESDLDLDTLQYLDIPKDDEGVEHMDEKSMMTRVDGDFQGLIVSSVVQGSAAWAAGIRPGDILTTSSATVGNRLWPKSTLEGVRSAISSRKAVASSIQFEFQHVTETVENQFELTLTRPIGLQLKETEDGYVEVTGFSENAPTLVRYAVKVGDRVLAVNSNLGDKMWPVSTVEGVISAVTSRLPGQQITFRFERPYDNMLTEIGYTESTEMAVQTATLPRAPTAASIPPLEQAELLKRCRDVIKRYTTGEQQLRTKQFVDKYAVPGLVADKVVDALASAGASVDPVTLSMIMGAYTSCRQPQKAIDAFEAVTCVKADGSTGPGTVVIRGKDNKQIEASTAAMDVFTVTALLKSHAMIGDLSSVRRVLAAVSGRDDAVVDGLEVATWPGTQDGTLSPDTKCYNVAISAAAESKAQNGLDLALLIFNGMSEANQKIKDRLPRDVVSYNTIISALTNAGRNEEAIDLFYQMRNTGLRPDKFSYTALAKAVSANGNIDDIEELLYDMRDQGIVPDVVTCNTVVKGLCEQRNIGAARKTLSLMEQNGVLPDSITYGLLMKGLLSSGNPSAALTLFESAISDRRTVVLTENVHLYTTAISAAAAIGDDERAIELISRMNAAGVKPNMKTMTALMGAYITSGKPQFAVDIYNRIPNPDGYAISQGLRAMCDAGMAKNALNIVSVLPTRQSTVTGKQLMMAYKNMIESSLKVDDFDLARAVFDDLIKKGNIPSKAIYQATFDSMHLFPKAIRRGEPVEKFSDEKASEKFKFLLFVLDSVSQRNIPCDGPLYTAILRYGTRAGGIPKKLSSLLVWGRTMSTGAKSNTIIDDREEDESVSLITSWEELFDKYDELVKDLSTPALLPALNVRINSSYVPMVLRAEKSLSYRPRQRQEV